MSLYSDKQIQTKLVRVAYHSNSRSEFRLPNANPCLSNIRIINVGAAQTGGTHVFYPVTSGVCSLINQISLYCDNQLVSQVRDAHKLYAFLNCRQTNNEELSRTSELKHTGLGYLVLENEQTRIVGQTPLTNDVNTTPRGWVALDNALRFLQGTTQVPTDVENWRVVIEWSKDLTNFNAGTAGHVNPTSIEICEPVLILDGVVGTKSPNEIEVRYWDLESDRIVITDVPAPQAGVVQSVNAKMDGFNKKFVGRMLLQNDMAEHLNLFMGNDRSIPQLAERINLTVNGMKMLSFDGISVNNKTQMLNDTWGAMCCAFFNDKTELEGSADIYGANTNMDGFGYGGISLSQRVNDLQWQYERTGDANVSHNSAFNFMVYAEVAKQFSYKSGKVIVANA